MNTTPDQNTATQEAYAYIRKEWPNVDTEWASHLAWLAASDWREAMDDPERDAIGPVAPLTMWVSHYLQGMREMSINL